MIAMNVLDKELDATRSKVFSVAMKASMLLLLPVVAASLGRFSTLGWNTVMCVHLVLSIMFAAFYFSHKWFSLKTKIHVFLSYHLFISLVGLVYMRITGASYFIFIPVVLGTLMFGKKTGIAYISAFALGFAAIIALHRIGILQSDIDFNAYTIATSTWIAHLVAILFISFIVVYGCGLYYSTFIRQISTLMRQSAGQEELVRILKNQDQRFNTFFNNYPHPVFIKDENANILFANMATKQVFDRHEHESESLQALGLKTLRFEFDRYDEDVLISKKETEYDVDYNCPGEDTIHYSIIKFPIFDIDGSTQIGVISSDITKRKQAERQNEILYKLISGNAADVIWVYNLKKERFTFVSQSVERMRGFTVQEVLEQNMNQALTPRSMEEVAQNLHDYMGRYANEGQKVTCHQIEQPCKDGSIVSAEVVSTVVLNGNGYPEEIVGITRDISERKLVEHKIYNAMVEAEERERERYAKELHDGLGPILSTCKIYLFSLESTSNEAKRTAHIARAGELLDEALLNIREISNNLSPHILINYGVYQAIMAFIDKLKTVCDIRFEVHSSLNDRLPEINEFTMYRALVELINNSRKYSGASLVTITLALEGSLVNVEYADNGKGFDYEHVRKSNKGFGLFNIENRIKKLHGEYLFSTKPGEGVKVSFCIKNP